MTMWRSTWITSAPNMRCFEKRDALQLLLGISEISKQCLWQQHDLKPPIYFAGLTKRNHNHSQCAWGETDEANWGQEPNLMVAYWLQWTFWFGASMVFQNCLVFKGLAEILANDLGSSTTVTQGLVVQMQMGTFQTRQGGQLLNQCSFCAFVPSFFATVAILGICLTWIHQA